MWKTVARSSTLRSVDDGAIQSKPATKRYKREPSDSLAPRFMYTYLHVQKQPFRLGLGGLGLEGGLGDKETWCRYQSVRKQPFRGLGFRGDLGTRRQGVGIKV